MKKRALNVLLCASLLLSLLVPVGAVRAYAADGVSYTDAAQLCRDQSVPVSSGKVFGGWYGDAGLTEPYKGADEISGSAWAKFVPDAILSIKYQLTAGTNRSSEKTSLRLITSVDNLKYRKVGFDVDINGSKKELSSDTVYKTLTGYVKEGTETYTPQEAFDPEASYFMGYSIKNIPASAFSTPIEVTPFWVTMDGTRVTGITRTIYICNSFSDDEYEENGSDYGKLLPLPSTVKVERDDVSRTYADAASLGFKAVRNEYESAQLLIKGTGSYSFELVPADLTCGDKVFLSTNFDIYAEKYIPFSDTVYDYGSGNMPDALLPMKAAKQYGENYTASGKNSALWVTVFVPADTVAGTYTGSFTLRLNNDLIKIPVTLEVYDYTLSGERNATTVFSWRYDRVAPGELDGSQEMMERYYDFFGDYRISLQSLPLGTASGEEYALYVDKYYDELTTYTILTEPGNIGENFWQQDPETKVKEIIMGIAQRSAPGRNLLDKAVFYIIDEPDITNEVIRASVISQINRLNAILSAAADAIGSDASGRFNSFKQISGWRESILNIPNIIPITRTEWLINNQSTASELLGAMNTLCPLFSDFSSESRISDLKALCSQYGLNLWWYGNSGPGAPGPTYHIADTNLLSSRSISWLQEKYGIGGNLYWDAAAYTTENSAEINEYINVYTCPYRRTEYEVNWPAGDGFLAYPGAPYGISGPIPSMRLMSICDGMEEYELLKAVKTGKGYSDSQMQSKYFGTLYEFTSERTFNWKTFSYVYTYELNMHVDGSSGLDFAALRTALLEDAATLTSPSVSGSSKWQTEYLTAGSGTPVSSPIASDGTVLMHFDSYEEITGAGLRVRALLGQTAVNKDAAYVSEGTGSWKIVPEGDYGDSHGAPWFRMRCSGGSFGSSDFSQFGEIRMDVYNSGDTAAAIKLSFTMYDNESSDYGIPDEVVYYLEPGAWTTVSYDLTDHLYQSRFDLGNVRYMTVTMLSGKEDRDDQVAPLYFDNLRGIAGGGSYDGGSFSFDTANGVGMEKAAEFRGFSYNAGSGVRMDLSRMLYAGSPYEDSARKVGGEGFGDYALMGDATGAIWPEMTVSFGSTQAKGRLFRFWIYVDADESAVAGKTFHIESKCGNRNGAANNVLHGSGLRFNEWEEVIIELGDNADALWNFVNLDGGTVNGVTVSKAGDSKVTVVMDNFRFDPVDWGPLM